MSFDQRLAVKVKRPTSSVLPDPDHLAHKTASGLSERTSRAMTALKHLDQGQKGALFMT